MKRKIVVVDREQSAWPDFLQEFFEDTRSEVVFLPESRLREFDRQLPDVVFVAPDLLSLPFIQKLRVLKARSEACRLFCLGKIPADSAITFDGEFDQPGSIPDFQKDLMRLLPVPETIRVLVMDDEPEIGVMITDFLEGRSEPVFDVTVVNNGEEGLKRLAASPPDVIVLDIKMPRRDGREVYLEMKNRGLEIPVIIFFDAVTPEELRGILQHGRPAILEKGSRLSSPPELAHLLKKMAYFG